MELALLLAQPSGKEKVDRLDVKPGTPFKVLLLPRKEKETGAGFIVVLNLTTKTRGL